MVIKNTLRSLLMLPIVVLTMACGLLEEKATFNNQVSEQMMKQWEASKEIVYEVNKLNVRELLIPIHQATLGISSDAWFLESSGDDPHLRTEKLDFDPNGKYWLKVRMTVPDNTLVIFYYGRKSEKPYSYSDDDTSRVEVTKGDNHFIVQLSDPGSIERNGLEKLDNDISGPECVSTNRHSS